MNHFTQNDNKNTNSYLFYVACERKVVLESCIGTHLAEMASLRVFRALNMLLWLAGMRSANDTQSMALRATLRPAIVIYRNKTEIIDMQLVTVEWQSRGLPFRSLWH